MKYHFLKWIGTILIISTGFVVAIRLTIKGRVHEQKFYNIVIGINNIDTINSKKLSTTIILGFSDKKTAKYYLSKRHEIIELIKKNFIEKAIDINDLVGIKVILFKGLNDALYPVEYVSFEKEPIIN